MATVKVKQRRSAVAGKGSVTLLQFMENQIRMMRAANRLGTAYNYEKTMKNITEFLRGVDVTFSSINEQFISEYNAFLIQRGMVRNSISFYMRILRAVYNKAVRQKLVKLRTDHSDLSEKHRRQ